MARIFAAARSMPVTVYLLSGIFPLVPGAGIFYTAYYLFTNDRALSSSKGIETFEVAVHRAWYHIRVWHTAEFV